MMGMTANAAVVCGPCLQSGELVESIEKSGIAPNALDPNYDKQVQFVIKASRIISQLLAYPDFAEIHAEATLRLLKTILPYDVEMSLPDGNREAFKKLYNKKNSVLKSKLDFLIKAGTFQEANRNQILEYMGVIPANGALEKLQQ
jgi:hypothetical protein